MRTPSIVATPEPAARRKMSIPANERMEPVVVTATAVAIAFASTSVDLVAAPKVRGCLLTRSAAEGHQSEIP